MVISYFITTYCKVLFMHCQFWLSTKTFRSFNECSTLEALSVVHSMYELSFYITLLFVMCHTCLNGFIVVPVIGISSSCGHYQRDWCVWYFINYCLMHVLVLPQLYLLIVFHECNVIFLLPLFSSLSSSWACPSWECGCYDELPPRTVAWARRTDQ